MVLLASLARVFESFLLSFVPASSIVLECPKSVLVVRVMTGEVVILRCLVR